jgi:uncharacterized membrane protein YqjE
MSIEPGGKSLGQIVVELIADIQVLVRQQIDLAVAELKESGRRLLRSSILLIAGLSILSISGLLVIISVAYGFVALGLPEWAAFLLDAGVFAAVAIVLLLMAKSNAAKVKAPSNAADEAQKSINEISEQLSRIAPDSL